MVRSRGPRLRLEEAVVEDMDSDNRQSDPCESRLVEAHADQPEGAASRAQGPGRRRGGESRLVHSYCNASRMFSREARRAGTIVATMKMIRVVHGIARTTPWSFRA